MAEDVAGASVNAALEEVTSGRWRGARGCRSPHRAGRAGRSGPRRAGASGSIPAAASRPSAATQPLAAPGEPGSTTGQPCHRVALDLEQSPRDDRPERLQQPQLLLAPSRRHPARPSPIVSERSIGETRSKSRPVPGDGAARSSCGTGPRRACATGRRPAAGPWPPTAPALLDRAGLQPDRTDPRAPSK